MLDEIIIVAHPNTYLKLVAWADRIAGRVREPYFKNTTIVKINLPDTG